jgi:hypothetical protein
MNMAIAYYAVYAKGDEGTEAPEKIAGRVAERINRELGGKPPKGGIYHAEGPTDDGGWWIFNVWQSEDDFTAFRQQILRPALEEVNAQPPTEMRRLQVWWDSSQVQAGS